MARRPQRTSGWLILGLALGIAAAGTVLGRPAAEASPPRASYPSPVSTATAAIAPNLGIGIRLLAPLTFQDWTLDRTQQPDAPQPVISGATPTATASPTPTATPPVSATPPTGPTPNPLSAACDDLEHHDERSWLENANFDGTYTNGVPNGWTALARGNVQLIEETGYEKFGRASLRVDGAGDFSAVISQTVSELQPGAWYQVFYATAQRVIGNGVVDGSLPLLREIGVDPTGGTDPDAATVIWGRFSGGQPDKDAGKYGGWKTLGNNNNPLVTARALGDRMTVFIRVRGWPDVTQGTAWIESAIFTEACDPGFP